MIVHEIILVDFKFGNFLQNHQFTKLKTLPKFPAIRYAIWMWSMYSANACFGEIKCRLMEARLLREIALLCYGDGSHT